MGFGTPASRKRDVLAVVRLPGLRVLKPTSRNRHRGYGRKMTVMRSILRYPHLRAHWRRPIAVPIIEPLLMSVPASRGEDMSKVRLIWLVFVVALTGLPGAAMAASCSEIVLGAVLSFTGRHSASGVLARNGYELATAQLKAGGGVRIGDKCYDLRIIYYDDESSPERGVEVAKRLIEKDRVQFILGPNSAAVADSVADLTEAARIPMLNGQGTPRTLYGKGRKYLFGMVTASERHLTSVLDLATVVVRNTGRASGSIKVALVSTDDPFVSDLRAGLLRHATGQAMIVAADEKLDPDLANMAPVLSKVRLAQADILVMTGDAKAAIVAARQIEELQVHTPIVAMTRCEAAGFTVRLGSAAANLLCAVRAVRTSGPVTVLSDYAAFDKAYRVRFKVENSDPLPDAAAQAALALHVFGDALRRAGSRDNEKVRDALAATDVLTFYGRLRFNKDGMAPPTPVVWRQIQNGKYNVVAPVERATHNFQWPRSGL